MQEEHTDSLKEEEKKLQEELDARETQEEIIWKSNSINLWLKEEEINSSFFFWSTIQHRQANRIVHLKKENGTKVETHEEIEHALSNHFKHLMEEPYLNRNIANE